MVQAFSRQEDVIKATANVTNVARRLNEIQNSVIEELTAQQINQKFPVSGMQLGTGIVISASQWEKAGMESKMA